jgi:hypothetical protein
VLRRASIHAGQVILIGKESDRSWEQGGDPSMLDFKLKGVRELMRKSRLSQKAVYSILNGQPVRRSTLGTFKRAVDG